MTLRAITYLQEQLLCFLLYDEKLFYQYSNRLKESLFINPDLLLIFQAYKTVIEKNISPSAAAISAELSGADWFVQINAIQLTTDISTDIETCLHGLEDYQRHIRTTNLLKTISDKNTDYDFDNIPHILNEYISDFYNLNEKKTIGIKEKIVNFLAKIETSHNGITGIETGFVKFDEFSGGLQPTNLTIIAGATSQGKSTLAMSILHHAAVIKKVPCALFSLELSESETMARLLAIDTWQPSKDMMRGKIDYKNFHAKLKLDQSQLIIDECYSISYEYLISQMRYYAAKFGTKLFVIDYLQMISFYSKGMTKEQEVGIIVKGIKSFARESNVSVILLCQLNRGKDKRGEPEPRLSDLRDSGQIEETADNVLFVYRPEYYGHRYFDENDNMVSNKEPCEGRAEIILAKGRNVGLMKFRTNFIKEIPAFKDESKTVPFVNFYEVEKIDL